MVIWILFEISLFINSIAVMNSANILAIFPMPSISHHILGSKITNELMKKGHHVTIITAYPDRLEQKGYEIISVEENLNIFEGYSKSSSLSGSKEVNTERTSTKSFFDREAHSPFEAIVYLNDISLQVAESTLANKNVQQLLKSGRKFDLIFMEYFLNEAYFGLKMIFNAPIVLLSTLPSSTFNDYLFANPGLPTYIPHILSPFSSDMNLWQRIQNSIITLFDIGYKHLIILPKHRALVKKYISESIELDHILHDVSLMLTNSHPSINTAVPHVKNVIEIGGFHIEPLGNLSDSLQKILDSSEEGVVIFSMGSNLNINDLPRKIVDNIMRSLSTIRQKVIFKWNGDLSEKVPENVILVDWLPQKDILGHPNIKAFVTHGGLLSVIEAAYHGIPMIGIPIYGDQRMNIATAVKDGYAVMVPFIKELAGDSLSNALNEVLTNETYTRNAKLRSTLLKDRLTKPLESAVYWIEYVIRYKGVDHLRSPGVKLRWYERNMLDIIVILTLITIILFLIFYYIIKHIIHCILKQVTCKKHHEKSD